MEPLTATIIGSTGLIGSHLLDQLVKDDHYSKVRLIVRRPPEVSNPNIEVRVIDFTDDQAFRSAVAGSSAVFCAIGTTRKKVKGDMTEYRKVDFDIPVKAARFCSETGCRKFLLVSSVGADSKSSNFYLKLKGEVEDQVSTLEIPHIAIFRPSMLLGKRTEKRPAEALAQTFSSLLTFLFPAKYKPIKAATVAEAMIAASKTDYAGSGIFHFTEMIKLTN